MTTDEKVVGRRGRQSQAAAAAAIDFSLSVSFFLCPLSSYTETLVALGSSILLDRADDEEKGKKKRQRPDRVAKVFFVL